MQLCLHFLGCVWKEQMTCALHMMPEQPGVPQARDECTLVCEPGGKQEPYTAELGQETWPLNVQADQSGPDDDSSAFSRWQGLKAALLQR